LLHPLSTSGYTKLAYLLSLSIKRRECTCLGKDNKILGNNIQDNEDTSPIFSTFEEW
jgi:hypothetical protein